MGLDSKINFLDTVVKDDDLLIETILQFIYLDDDSFGKLPF